MLPKGGEYMTYGSGSGSGMDTSFTLIVVLFLLFNIIGASFMGEGY
jgi:uncharacterized protein (TIGR01732 family)